MRIRKLIVNNFKCIKQLKIETPRILLICGANSSGKTSLLYSIASLFQSHDYTNYLELNGDYCSLGDFTEVVHNHERGRKISIGFEADTDQGEIEIDTTYQCNNRQLPELFRLFFKSDSFSCLYKKGPPSTIDGTYDTSADHVFQLMRTEEFTQFIQKLSENSESSTTKSLAQALNAKQGATKFKYSAKTEEEFRDVVQNDFSLYFKYSEVQRLMTQLGNSFNFVGSFRHSPERTYYRKSKRKLKIGVFGENYVEQLLRWSENRSPKLSPLKSDLARLGLASSLRFKKFPGGRFEIRVKTYNRRIDANVTDVGLGLTQFLPILVADYQLPKKSIFAISQPEIHLHPSAQAEYMEIIAARMHEFDKQYLVETHSEYMINRARLMVARGTLAEDDVKIIYFDVNTGAHSPIEVFIRRDGRLDGAPTSFFNTYQMDSINIALAAQ